MLNSAPEGAPAGGAGWGRLTDLISWGVYCSLAGTQVWPPPPRCCPECALSLSLTVFLVPLMISLGSCLCPYCPLSLGGDSVSPYSYFFRPPSLSSLGVSEESLWGRGSCPRHTVTMGPELFIHQIAYLSPKTFSLSLKEQWPGKCSQVEGEEGCDKGDLKQDCWRGIWGMREDWRPRETGGLIQWSSAHPPEMWLPTPTSYTM